MPASIKRRKRQTCWMNTIHSISRDAIKSKSRPAFGLPACLPVRVVRVMMCVRMSVVVVVDTGTGRQESSREAGVWSVHVIESPTVRARQRSRLPTEEGSGLVRYVLGQPDVDLHSIDRAEEDSSSSSSLTSERDEEDRRRSTRIMQ